MQAQISVLGIEEIESVLRELPFTVAQRVQGAGCAAIARAIVKQLKIQVPVDTGALKKTIRVRRIKDRIRGRTVPGAAAMVQIGSFEAFYSVFVEYGTVRQQANPFMRRSVEYTQALHLQVFAKAVGKEWEKTVRLLASKGGSPLLNRLVRLSDGR